MIGITNAKTNLSDSIALDYALSKINGTTRTGTTAAAPIVDIFQTSDFDCINNALNINLKAKSSNTKFKFNYPDAPTAIFYGSANVTVPVPVDVSYAAPMYIPYSIMSENGAKSARQALRVEVFSSNAEVGSIDVEEGSGLKVKTNGPFYDYDSFDGTLLRTYYTAELSYDELAHCENGGKTKITLSAFIKSNNTIAILQDEYGSTTPGIMSDGVKTYEVTNSYDTIDADTEIPAEINFAIISETGRRKDYVLELYRTPYNYGDGSLNTVNAGYEGHIALNGNSDIYRYTGTKYGTGNYFTLRTRNSLTTTSTINQFGLFDIIEGELMRNGGFAVPTDVNNHLHEISPISDKVTVLNQFDGLVYNNSSASYKSITKGLISSGLNTKTFTKPITGNKTVGLGFFWANLSGSVTFSSLKFLCNDVYLTLEEMVDKGTIKPLVLLGNRNESSSYSCTSINNYTGNTCSGNFADFEVIFMTNENANIKGFQINSSKALGRGDGWLCGMTDIDNFRITYV